ncbi:solute carrier family 2, facilitated glucose transporter member 8 isoform X2 [Chroicocephalus ridibundus]|uniref:solute carrier family 2, facilitated glucose transporter member 8 isoform X2 n=1 Tax=Chroicocephalus ridibundus TaxID=1192867 RepID=UPI002FDDC27D
MAAEESRCLLGYPASDSCPRVQNKKLYLAAFAAVLGPLSFGFVLGYSSPVIPELRKIDDPKLRLDGSQASWFGVYISEVSHPKVRGMLGSCVQLMVVTGILGAYVAGITLKWRWLAVLCSFPPCIMLLFMSFMPETPRFLLNQSKRSEAIAALCFLRGPHADHAWECGQIEASVQEEGLNLSEFKNPSIYRPLLIGVALMFFQQATGINAVMFYAETIFEDANFKDSRMASVVVGSIQVCFTALAAIIIDKTGRKVLLYVSGVIMALSTALFGLYFKIILPDGNNSSNPDVWFTLNSASPGAESSISWLAVVSLGLFVAGFALGWGPVPWLVISEIFPLKAKGISSGACVLTNWIMAFLITKEFNDFIGFLTSYGTFWLFSAFCCLSVIFTAFYVPETKGQTLEQIETYFRRP